MKRSSVIAWVILAVCLMAPRGAFAQTVGGENKETLITLENKAVSLGIDKNTGCIRSVVWKGKDFDLCQPRRWSSQGSVGGVRVYDELTKQSFSDKQQKSTVQDFQVQGQQVSFSKQFEGADFKIRETLTLEEDSLHWEAQTDKRDGSADDRGLQVEFFLPVLYGKVWVPAYQGEFDFDSDMPFVYSYGDNARGGHTIIVVPVLSMFNPGADVGYTMVVPFEDRIAWAAFRYGSGDKLASNGYVPAPDDFPVLSLNYFNVGLIKTRPLKTGCRVFFHEGDWRPGLGLVYQHYREFFDPKTPEVSQKVGVYVCGTLETADHLKDDKALGLRYFEFHANFPWYGEYFPDQDGFRRVLPLERIFHKSDDKMDPRDVWKKYQTLSEADLVKECGTFDGEVLWSTRAKTHEVLSKMIKAGIHSYYYINFSDGFIPWANENYSDAIAKKENGEPFKGWPLTILMNPDLKYSFGPHIVDNAKKILKEYPEIDGFFYDAYYHTNIDYGHDDGLTVIHNKPAYSINLAYDGVAKTIKDLMVSLGKDNFSNVGSSIRTLQYNDCQLLEGEGNDNEEKLFYAALAKPFVMFSSRKYEETLRRLVVLGGFPNIPGDYDGGTPRVKKEYLKLYHDYVPMLDQLRGRVFCFEPDPMRLTHNMIGKLFTIKDGYAAGIRSEGINEADTIHYSETPTAYFRVKRGCDVGRVEVMVPGDKKPPKAAFTFNGSIITVPLTRYKNCCLVKLLVTGNTHKEIVKMDYSEVIGK